jgi:hypothetical protein
MVNMRYLLLLVLLGCTVPAEPTTAPVVPVADLQPVVLNTRFVSPPDVVTAGTNPRIQYRNDFNATCRVTTYDWDTGSWAGHIELGTNQGGAFYLGKLTRSTYLHLQCFSPIFPASTGWAVHLIEVP